MAGSSPSRPGRASFVAASVLFLAAATSAQLPAAGPNAAVRDGERELLSPVAVDLAGESLDRYPGFTHRQVFLEGTPVEFAIDLAQDAGLAPGVYSLWVVRNRPAADPLGGATLVDVRGAAQLVTLTTGTLAGNVVTVDVGTLSGASGTDFGVGYDLVLDVDMDGTLSGGDRVDGLGGEAGFWVVKDPSAPGPLAVTEANYFVTGVTAGFEGQNTFYPTAIASMGELPLVVISHGNGHNYNWYDHLGTHLASWGFVVMSHANNTAPGVNTASITTLDHTETFLSSLDSILGGVLDGHVDGSEILWIGHSRGGEGIVRAFDKLRDGVESRPSFGHENIVGLSSIAPTVFAGTGVTNPHGVPFSLWTGAADNDVNGCADTPITWTNLIHERADGDRFSIHMHGAGHGVFHNGTGGLVAQGPCQINRSEAFTVMRGYLLPLAQHLFHRHPAAPEFLWRQFEDLEESFYGLGSCVVVNKTFQLRSQPRFVVDDWQDSADLTLSTSGGAVSMNVGGAGEQPMSDTNSTFTHFGGQPTNGMTFSANNEGHRAFFYGWTSGPKSVAWDVVPRRRDLTRWTWLSFRMGQVTRHPNTTAELGDLTLSVALRDEDGVESIIDVGAYGGGVEEPYQRTSCGGGAGWANFFETFRIPLVDFLADGSGLDLARIDRVQLLHGDVYGSGVGRVVMDDLEFVVE